MIVAVEIEEALIELVYISVHELKTQKKWGYLDRILGDVRLEHTPLSVLLSYLTATAPCKDRLHNRKRLYDEAFSRSPEACIGLE